MGGKVKKKTTKTELSTFTATTTPVPLSKALNPPPDENWWNWSHAAGLFMTRLDGPVSLTADRETPVVEEPALFGV
ncbi:hypothetical protein EYF80_048761 [Liparis tanakae]|uniref:Uncharacterized protein n=1 Tax=Liparis tanakae TaxID=230148 RepID=A0A4Z2FJW7_9TELE|nr:hypothetical protein EYF80_048761 [Liparis tanakae]